MVLGFKGFKPGLIATLGNGSYQYQPGEVSKTIKAKCANAGFHYCLDPLDCMNWYAWDGKMNFGPLQPAVTLTKMITGREAVAPKLSRCAG